MFGIIYFCLVFNDMDVEVMEFERLQGEWVAAQYRPEEILAAVPPRYLNLLSGKYRTRQETMNAIRGHGYMEFTVLVLASQHRDPNIRLAAEQRLRELYVCYMCLGAGVCNQKHMSPESSQACAYCDYNGYCRKCDGTGDRRYIAIGEKWKYRDNIFSRTPD